MISLNSDLVTGELTCQMFAAGATDLQRFFQKIFSFIFSDFLSWTRIKCCTSSKYKLTGWQSGWFPVVFTSLALYLKSVSNMKVETSEAEVKPVGQTERDAFKWALKWWWDFPSLSTSGISSGGLSSGERVCVWECVCEPGMHPLICVLLMGEVTFYCKWWIMAPAEVLVVQYGALRRRRQIAGAEVLFKHFITSCKDRRVYFLCASP